MAFKRTVAQWATIYRALGNPYRLRILQLLRLKKSLSVTQLTAVLGISFKNTSRNLGILLKLDLVEAEGKRGHVSYKVNNRLSVEISTILKNSIW